MTRAETETPRGAARAYLFLIVVMMLWAGNSIVGRAVRDTVPPLTLSFVRWGGATLILAPFAWRPLRADAAKLRAHWRIVLLLGALGIALFNALLYTGLRHTTATNVMLIQAATPALVLLFNRLHFGERAPFLQILGVLASTFGVAWVVAQGDIAILLHMDLGLGDAIMLIATVIWALYTALLRLKPDIHPLSFLTTTFAIGAIAMLPFAAHEAMTGASIHWSVATIGALAYVAVLPSIVAYLLYNLAVATLGGGRSGQMITLMPLFGALLAAALLGEALHAFHLWAMAMILVGILLSAIAGRERA